MKVLQEGKYVVEAECKMCDAKVSLYPNDLHPIIKKGKSGLIVGYAWQCPCCLSPNRVNTNQVDRCSQVRKVLKFEDFLED